jgi:TIR domain/S1 RNA binding domain
MLLVRCLGGALTVPGGIFISYRRQETSDLAGRLADRLADRFGEDQVFMDVDTIDLGVDFAEAINQAVGTCEVLLAVIGPHWLTATDKGGRRRLDDPDDIVRLEVQAALDRDVRVIPVLVGGAAMPERGELPGGLGGLARRNALSVRHDSFRSDVARLVAGIERIVGTGGAIPKVGDRYLGTVVKTAAFGAFISLTSDKDGLIHISRLGGKGQRVQSVEDVVNVGDKLWVDVIEIDSQNRISLKLAEGEL